MFISLPLAFYAHMVNNIAGFRIILQCFRFHYLFGVSPIASLDLWEPLRVIWHSKL